MKMTFLGQRAYVTGAAQGIGQAVVQLLAAQGVQVFAVDVQSQHHEHPNIHALQLDISRSAEVEASVAQVEQTFGPIDYLVNVAGILRLGPILTLTDQDWLDTFAVNTHGCFFVSRAVGKRMQTRKRGVIVTVGSNAAHIPRMHMAAYAASKAATGHLMRCLGLELSSDGIRCNVVSPGFTDTHMQRQLWTDPELGQQGVIRGSLEQYRHGIPLGKIATPEDIACTVLFLLSDQAHHITLQDWVVDGGATLGV